MSLYLDNNFSGVPQTSLWCLLNSVGNSPRVSDSGGLEWAWGFYFSQVSMMLMTFGLPHGNHPWLLISCLSSLGFIVLFCNKREPILALKILMKITAREGDQGPRAQQSINQVKEDEENNRFTWECSLKGKCSDFSRGKKIRKWGSGDLMRLFQTPPG